MNRVTQKLDLERVALDAYSVVWEPSRKQVRDHQRATKAAIAAVLLHLSEAWSAVPEYQTNGHVQQTVGEFGGRLLIAASDLIGAGENEDLHALLSGEGRSEPTPAPREQWAVEHPKVNLSAHNSPHSVLYTLSKLPGGRIVVRDAPDQPWRPETRCLCGESKPADRHYTGCPDTSEVVNPTSREPRVWRHRGTAYEPDPGNDVRVRDCHGDIWTARDRGPGDRVWETPDTAPFRWDYVLKKWGPLTEVVTPKGTP